MIRILVVLLSSVNLFLAVPAGCVKSRAQDAKLTGKWIIELRLDIDRTPHKIQFDAEPSGTGRFLLLDRTSSLNTIVPTQANWSVLAQDNSAEIRISGAIEFPIGNVGRKAGKITFVGTFENPDTISGSTTFVNIASPEIVQTGSFVAKQDISSRAPSGQPPSVTLLSLNSGEVVLRRKQLNIEWSVHASGAIASQQVLLSLDKGESFTPITPPLDGAQRSFLWRVPYSLGKTKKALLKIMVTDENGHQGADISDRTFRIK